MEHWAKVAYHFRDALYLIATEEDSKKDIKSIFKFAPYSSLGSGSSKEFWLKAFAFNCRFIKKKGTYMRVCAFIVFICLSINQSMCINVSIYSSICVCVMYLLFCIRFIFHISFKKKLWTIWFLSWRPRGCRN